MNKQQCIDAVAAAFGVAPWRVAALPDDAHMTIRFVVVPGPFRYDEAEIMEHTHEARQDLPAHLIVRIEVLQ